MARCLTGDHSQPSPGPMLISIYFRSYGVTQTEWINRYENVSAEQNILIHKWYIISKHVSFSYYPHFLQGNQRPFHGERPGNHYDSWTLDLNVEEDRFWGTIHVIKTGSYQRDNSHYENEVVLRRSYRYNGNIYINMTTSLYWSDPRATPYDKLLKFHSESERSRDNAKIRHLYKRNNVLSVLWVL